MQWQPGGGKSRYLLGRVNYMKARENVRHEAFGIVQSREGATYFSLQCTVLYRRAFNEPS